MAAQAAGFERSNRQPGKCRFFSGMAEDGTPCFQRIDGRTGIAILLSSLILSPRLAVVRVPARQVVAAVGVGVRKREVRRASIP